MVRGGKRVRESRLRGEESKEVRSWAWWSRTIWIAGDGCGSSFLKYGLRMEGEMGIV